jgi:hypothetical protein
MQAWDPPGAVFFFSLRHPGTGLVYFDVFTDPPGGARGDDGPPGGRVATSFFLARELLAGTWSHRDPACDSVAGAAVRFFLCDLEFLPVPI